MASPPKSAPQDMPPVGGYGPLQWERIPIKTVFGGKTTKNVIITHINLRKNVILAITLFQLN